MDHKTYDLDKEEIGRLAGFHLSHVESIAAEIVSSTNFGVCRAQINKYSYKIEEMQKHLDRAKELTGYDSEDEE